MNKDVISVNVISDVACPWCYIGKRRLEEALNEWKGIPVEVTWHPYQLDPTIPEEGMNRTTYLGNKFGDSERITAMTNQLTEVGKMVGVSFDFGENWLAVNTLPLHQLLHVAALEGFKDTLKERFFKAYFEETLHLNSLEVLSEIMKEYGWNAEKVKAVVNDNAIAETVKKEIRHYQEMGVSGVPFFIINNTYGFSGAQPPKVFLEAFSSIAPITTASKGDSCNTEEESC